jgi:ribosomal protein S27E
MELSAGVGEPGLGWSLVAVRAREVSCGNTAAMSTGGGGVVRVMIVPAV